MSEVEPALIQRNVALSPYNSWRVGGIADYYSTPATIDELKEVMTWATNRRIPITFLSGGTNVLISDDGVEGLVIHLRKFTGIETAEESGLFKITALAGTAKSELLRIFLKNKLEPAVFLAGLPGDVGAGVVMNAGIGEAIRPREFVELTEWIEVLRFESGKFEVHRFEKIDLDWKYRHCDGWQPGVIVRVGLSWPNVKDISVMDRTREMNRARLKKQPLEWPSCGSVFRNPEGYKAGQLIDQLGLRGFRIGGAEVSEKHANFVINRENATAGDLHLVIEHVRTEVLKAYQISLQTEVVYIGRWKI